VGILPGTEGSRIILTPRTCKDAYAYWEVPDGVFDRLEDEGGRELVLRLYDVTDLDLDRQDPHSVKEFTCDPTDSDRHVPIAVDDRDYIAELGYVTPEGDWLRIARSDYVRVPACDSDIWNEVSTRETSVHTSVQDTGRRSAVAGTPPTTHPASIDQPTTPQAGGTLGQVALGSAGIAAVGAASQAVTRSPVSPTQESRVMFVPRSANDAYAYWELSEERKAALRKLGGRKLSLRVYDVTDIDMTTQPVHSVRQYDCDEQTADLHIPIYEADRDYIAELGYIADDGRWLRVARSETVRFPSSLDATRTVQTPETPVRGVNTRADGDRSDTVKPGTANPGTTNPSTVNPLKGGGTSAGIVGAAGATETAARMVSDSATRAIPDRDRTDRPMAPERGVGSQPTGSPPVSGVTASGDTGSRVTASGITATPARSPVEVVRRIILVPRTPESAYAYWEVSDSAKVEAKRQGGTQFMLRVHDATGIDIDHQLPHSTQEYRCAEEEQDKHISIPASDRDYIAEIGYYTDDHRWLRIIRSFHVSVPSDPALF
jgi:phosphate transport system substrate-binding protein